MGNTSSSGASGRRRHGNRWSHPTPPPPAAPQPEITANRYVFAAATPYPSHFSNQHPSYYQYPPYYPSPPPPPSRPMPLPGPYDHHRRGAYPHMDQVRVGGRYPYGPVMAPQTPFGEHQKAVTIRNDVNLKKETLRMECDSQNPGKFLVTFMFDATVPGSITVMFLAKEGADCTLTPMKADVLKPVTVGFEKGLQQRFIQPVGTGIELETFEEELLKLSGMDVHPLAIKAEALPDSQVPGTNNSQITQAVIGRGEYQVRVLKQILWADNKRYEQQEIFGIGNSVKGNVDNNDLANECVICWSKPCNTTVLPCRHMCMCNGCAKVLRFLTNRCPLCRQPFVRLLEMPTL